MPVLSPLAWCTLGLMFLLIVSMVKTSLWWMRTPRFNTTKTQDLTSSLSSLRAKLYSS
uniref:ATP synthase F0 subunit 8 n=1 Tax=Siphonosoma cumanense TaxID=6444 RepID=A0A7D4ZIQ6_SIPCU|nr:ATP synthase F0 subunit 8 [Siphonosoma cumanense]QKS32594.1 ATP synthase F0 subunit 8 [Siphonosoma cumanense]